MKYNDFFLKFDRPDLKSLKGRIWPPGRSSPTPAFDDLSDNCEIFELDFVAL